MSGQGKDRLTLPLSGWCLLGVYPFQFSHVVGNQALQEHKIREGLGHEANYFQDSPLNKVCGICLWFYLRTTKVRTDTRNVVLGMIEEKQHWSLAVSA